MKLMVVLGEGGHTKQLLSLVDLLGGSYDYHYIICKEDGLSADHIRYPGAIHYLPRPRGKRTAILIAVLRTVLTGLQSLWILLRVRPVAILSAGPAVAVPISVVGKLLGVLIIFVESASRVTTLSLTGRIMYRWADLFFVQWPQWVDKCPRSIYAGRLV
jgi:beta-1,4-N-acetylglucosaminyltransferase